MPRIVQTADDTPPELGLTWYEGMYSRYRVKRRDPDTQLIVDLTNYTNPTAVWKPARGSTTVVALTAEFDLANPDDAIRVTVTPTMKTQVDVKGVWEVEATDPDGEPVKFITGPVTLEREVGD